MRNVWNFLAVVYLAVGLIGCSAAVTKVVEVAGNDLEVTSALAKKYNKPQVAKCADFMLAKVKQIQASNTTLEALRAEPTAGLFSAALKAALTAEMLKQLESTNSPQFQAEFKAACSEVAGDVLFNVMQDAAKVARR